MEKVELRSSCVSFGDEYRDPDMGEGFSVLQCLGAFKVPVRQWETNRMFQVFFYGWKGQRIDARIGNWMVRLKHTPLARTQQLVTTLC